jgi:hypothetical protein
VSVNLGDHNDELEAQLFGENLRLGWIGAAGDSGKALAKHDATPAEC